LTRPAATISVDVDPVDLHLIGYGHRGLPPDASVYTTALPRLIEAFARARVAATLFVVGRDAAAHAGVLRAAAAAGHEIASHSHTHPLAFARLPAAAMREELRASREALEQACGERVIGYRAPNFDLDRRAMRVLVECGYEYDASGYPTPMLLPARLLLAFKSGRPGKLMGLTVWPFTWRRSPYRQPVDGGSLVEFPVAVTPGARMPVYHTARYYLSAAAFERHLDGFARRGESLSYPLHAVDALGLREDRVDMRLAAHPGMQRPLADKLELIEKSLEAITRRFDVATFRARLGSVT
jgi:peptidoglycan-N-acetylglucosamine deacetylase